LLVGDLVPRVNEAKQGSAMRKVFGHSWIAWVLAGCGTLAGDAAWDEDPAAESEGRLAIEAGEGAEQCPSSLNHCAGIQSWRAAHTGRAVTVCHGLDGSGQLVAVVQMVNFSAGAKMRVVSLPAASSGFGTPDTLFEKKSIRGWYDWTKANVTSPSGSLLLSVTNGAPFMSYTSEPDKMSFPQKKWNTITSTGAEMHDYNDYPGAPGKRVFALSDPRSSAPQIPYIEPFGYGGRANELTVIAELAIYQGRPVRYFDATVALHPDYGNESEESEHYHDPRTYIATRDTTGRWSGDQNRVYLLTTRMSITIDDARLILVEDFKAMYTMQLDGGGSTRFYGCNDGCPSEGRCYQESFPDQQAGRPVPEVLAIYDAP
jgi:Phosphodiester glycosidase